jgi:hypothetical protein
VLRIVFPKPGFFLTDVRTIVMLDGGVVYDGSFLGGIDISGGVAPGIHTVTTRIELGVFARERSYAVEVPTGRSVTLHLEYSRFWGNFSKSPKIVGS